MQFNPFKHHRRSIRLRGYDYSSEGAYFVTICTHDRACLFGQVVEGEMVLNEIGKIAEQEWLNTPEKRPNVVLDEFIVMPNHVHGIIIIDNSVGAYRNTPRQDDPSPRQDDPSPRQDDPSPRQDDPSPRQDDPSPRQDGRTSESQAPFRSPSGTLGAIVRGFKSASTKQINIYRNTPGIPVWQRNYYEHIIRNADAHNRIRAYIVNNPRRWPQDEENPAITKNRQP
jgi:putative transposase